MKEELDAQDEPNRDQDKKHQGTTEKERVHPPIVITGGGSVDFEFDCDDCPHTHYVPDDEGRPTRYSAAGLRIQSVTVTKDGSSLHTCSHVTPNSRVVIDGNKDEFDDEPINVIGGGASIVIAFDHEEYRPNGSNRGRKKFRHAVRKIKRLRIYHPGVTAPAHDCTEIPSNGKCIITIKDEH